MIKKSIVFKQGDNKNVKFDNKRQKREDLESSTLNYTEETNSSSLNYINETVAFNAMEIEYGHPIIKYKIGAMKSEYLFSNLIH